MGPRSKSQSQLPEAVLLHLDQTPLGSWNFPDQSLYKELNEVMNQLALQLIKIFLFSLCVFCFVFVSLSSSLKLLFCCVVLANFRLALNLL